MNKIPYLFFALIFFLGYLITEFSLPKLLKWAPELMSGTLFIFLVIRAASTKNINISIKYPLLFGIFLLHILVGIIINDVEAGPIIAGVRYYFKFFPLFLLPAVFNFTDTQIKNQLIVLLGLGLLQLPVVLYQRFFEYARSYTGDVISGTLGISSILSIFIVCSIIILTAFYLKKQISGRTAFIVGFLLFIPSTLNETKGTMILLPAGLTVVVLTSVKTKIERQKMLGVAAAFSLFAAVFFIIYDQIYDKWGPDSGGLAAFFSSDRVGNYLYRGIEFDPDILDRHEGVGVLSLNSTASPVKLARIDRLIAPFSILAEQPAKLFFGLGVGNVSVFRYSEYQGQYAYIGRFFEIENIMISLLVWEVGVGGTLVYFLLFYLLFTDCRRLSQQNSILGWIAVGWIGILAIIIVALPYKNIFGFNVIGYLFFYFSGLIAAASTKINSSRSQFDNTPNSEQKHYFVSQIASQNSNCQENAQIQSQRAPR